MTAPAAVIVGDRLEIAFTTWDQAAYDLFLRTKALPEHEVLYDRAEDRYTVRTHPRFAALLGATAPAIDRDWLPLPSFLWDYQRHFTREALAAKRYAVWADTGLGKTLIQLEWLRQVARRTGGRVLYVVPLNLIPQALEMAATFYGGELSITLLRTREGLLSWCRHGAPGIAITNPEKFIPEPGGLEYFPEVSDCAGVCLDESSLLKTGGGKIKWSIVKSCRGVEYKLSCTATPAPNDPIEYASQASFLEKIRDEGEVIWTFFVRDDAGEWKVKDLALEAFYRFLSGWSCYLRHPARYGFADNLIGLPDPERIEHWLPASAEQLTLLQRMPDATGQCRMFEPEKLGIVERGKLAQAASGFLYEDEDAAPVESLKPDFTATLALSEMGEGHQVLVWTQFDETAALLAARLADVPGVEVLTGKVPVAQRPEMLERFRRGESRILITRPRLLGFGANLQMCSSMIFADVNDSAEQLYQAERRAYRYGQMRRVRIHYPLVEHLQEHVWKNVQAKLAAFERDVSTMETLYVKQMRTASGEWKWTA